MKLFLFLLLFISANVNAQSTSSFFSLADDFFETYVENGKVKYAEIKQNPKAFNDLLAIAKTTKLTPADGDTFKAFWINAYNLGVIQGVVQNYPIGSPLEVDGFFDRQKYSFAQQSVTLDEIEHAILFDTYPEDARLHFVLVCAAKSCPELVSQAFTPAKVEQQLQTQTEKTLNDPAFVRIDNNRVLFSELMKWYNNDFTSNGRSLIDYTNQFRKDKIPANLQEGYYEYDWGLNEFRLQSE